MINRKLFTLIFSFSFTVVCFAQPSFNNVAVPSGLDATTTASATTRVITGDFDNDGDIDVLSQLNGGSNTQVDYHQNNGGTFTVISGTGSPSTFSSGPFNGLSFIDIQCSKHFVMDIDNDGDMDIFETNATPTLNRYLQNSGGVFTSVALPSGAPTTMALGFSRFLPGDFDNDGDVDFLHQQASGTASIFYCENNGSGSFTSYAANGAGTFTSGVFNGMTFTNVLNTVGMVADYDNDGDADIYHWQAAGTTYYRNNGGSFSNPGVPSGLPTTLSGLRFLPTDFDGDGDVDVLYQLGSTATNSISYATNNGAGVYSSVNATDGTGVFTSGPFNGLAFADIFATLIFPFDYDVDGDIDVYKIPLGAAGANTMYQCGGTPPSLIARTPLNGATGVSTTTNLTMTFSEAVFAGTSNNNIYIKRFSDNAIIQTIASNSGSVSGSGTTNITVTLSPLAASTQYYVTFDDQAFKDNQGLIFGYYDHKTKERKGYTSKTFWNFTTIAASPEINIQGNSTTIVDGDVSPTLLDHTDFLQTSACSGSVVRTFTIQNTGTSALTIASVNISGAQASDFTITLSPASIVAAGSSTTFQVTFNPAVIGVSNATITINNDDADESVYDFAIQGVGIDPNINIQGNSITIVDGDNTPSTLDDTDFGSLAICPGPSTIVRTFQIQNTGTSTLTIIAISPGSSDFTWSTSPFSIPAGTYANFDITFNPSSVGLKTAVLSIQTNDCSPFDYNFTVQGMAVAPEINLTGNGNNIVDGSVTTSGTNHTGFGSTSVCSGTITRTYTVQNSGTSTLNISSVTITGTHAADFSVTTAPASTVAVAGSTTFQVTFNPSATGSRTATINVFNNDCDEATYDFAIQGTGTDPEINLTGNGNNIIDGQITPSGTNHTGFGPISVCSGTIIRTYTIQNTGVTTLNITGVSITGANAADFSVTSAPASTVAAGGSTTMQVTFDPSAVGSRNATVNVTNDDCDEATYDFAIQGTGTDPEINVQGNSTTIVDGDVTPTASDHSDFGSQSVCSGTIVRTFTIQNTGTATLNITGVSITGTNAADFSVTTAPSSTVAAAGSTTFQVSFDPSASGIRNATINITNNDCDEATYDFAVQGTGTDPEINLQGNSTTIVNGDVSPSAADHSDFGSQSVCSGTIVRTFTIQNTGTTTLNISGVSITGTNAADFSVTAAPASTVASAGSTTFQVSFDPSASGVRTATITVTNSDCDEATYDFAIQGSGSDPEINITGNGNNIPDGQITPTGSNHTGYGPVLVCSGTMTRTYTIQNTGATDLTISSITITGTHASDFTVTTPPVSPIVSGGSTTFQVTFDPSAIGSRQATINVLNDDCDEATYDYAIQGMGAADGTAPNAICQSITVSLDASGTATVLASQIDNGSTDNCSVASIAITPSAFTCANLGANTVTLTVTDPSGNTATCSATVNVNDVTAPVANCQNTTAYLNISGNVIITGALINNLSSDACGITGLAASPSTFSCANIGSNNVTLTVTDLAGNTSQCSATVNVMDTLSPVLGVQNVTVYVDSFGTVTVNPLVVNVGSSDACGISSYSLTPNTFSCNEIGTNTSQFSVTDVNGNVSTAFVTITVMDTLAPTATCQNATVYLDVTGNVNVSASLFNAGSTDNCSIASYALSDSSFDCTDIGSSTISLLVTDVEGNVSSCSAVITVLDTIDPVVSCQDISLTLGAGGSVNLTASAIDNGSSDNCSSLSLSATPNTFTCANVGTNSVTLTVTDGTGNTSFCTATVTILPAAPINQSFTVCFGESITVGANTYTTTGIYNDTLVSSAGCDSVLITNLTIDPALDVTTSLTGVTVTANATGVSYQWIDCDNGFAIISGATNQSFTPSADGNYAVIIDDGSCSDTSACVLVVGLGIDQSNLSMVNAYPNPFDQFVQIAGLVGGEHLTIFNLFGEVVYSTTNNASIQNLHLGYLSSGVYILRVRKNNDVKNIRLVKK